MGLGRHHLENVTQVLHESFVFGDDGTLKSLGYIPEGSRILRIYAVVGTAFDSGTSDVIDVGFRNHTSKSDDPDGLGTDIDVSSAGTVSETPVAANVSWDSQVEVTAQYDSTGTAPTAGAATLVGS